MVRARIRTIGIAVLALLAGCGVSSDGPLGSTELALCSSVSLSASPRVVAPGATVTLTASAACGLGETAQYRFLRRGPGETRFSPIRGWGSSSFPWSTAGQISGGHQLKVQARATGSGPGPQSKDDFFVAIGDTCHTITSFEVQPAASAHVGDTVSLSAAASCTAGELDEYQFQLREAADGSPLQPLRGWGDADFEWDTADYASGDYELITTARAVGNASRREAAKRVPYTLHPEPVTVAFIARQGLGADALAVLALIASEGADMVLHQGNLDMGNDPDAWDAMVTSVLGPSFPYFVSIGNHDSAAWSGYETKLADRLASVPGAACTGALGTMASCVYKNVHFLLLSPGVGNTAADTATFIDDSFAGSAAVWKICSWNKAQRLMQVGLALDEVGWEPYEACRAQGAIVATGVRAHYARTNLMSSFETQAIADPASPYTLGPGASIAFVSGLGGFEVSAWDLAMANNPWWAVVRASDNGAKAGALFCTLQTTGASGQASCYFKDIDGTLYDQFELETSAALD